MDKIEGVDDIIEDVKKVEMSYLSLAYEKKASGQLLNVLRAMKKDNVLYKGNAEQKYYDIGQEIYKDLWNRGRFYKHVNGDIIALFWYDVPNNILYNLQSEIFESLYFWRYELLPTTTLGKSAIAILRNNCFNEGHPITVYRFSHYDIEKNVLYWFNNDNMIFKIDGSDKIEEIQNGSEGIFFEKEHEAEPIVPVYNDNDYLNSLVFDQINFDDGANLNYEEMHFLFKHWFYCIFFPELLEVKPISLLWGRKGSGKTSLFQVIKKVLTGRGGNVESMPEKVADFIALITSQHVVCMDNVDSYNSWMNDMLAQCATGQVITLRTLYKTNVPIKFHPRVFIGITSRSPRFRRDDVADRLLIFKVKRFDNFIPQSEIISKIYQHRDEIWGDILTHLNKLINYLGEHKGESISSPFRLADFYSFVIKTSDENTERIDAIFTKMDKTQTDYILENEPFFEFLNYYMEGKQEPVAMSTGSWFTEGKILMKDNKGLDWYKTSAWFGIRLNAVMEELSEYWDVNITLGRANKRILTVGYKESG